MVPRLCGCKFKVLGRRNNNLDQWCLMVPHLDHNHNASTTYSAHPSLRQLKPEAHAGLVTMTAADVQLRTIVAVLREGGNRTEIVIKVVYNAKQKIWADALNGRTLIQALLLHF
jgi:hypothetical protein